MQVQDIILRHANQLSVHEFITTMGFEIDQLYVDRFWDNIADDKWVYVGNEMLEWIGYVATTDERRLKQNYVLLLDNNFTKPTDYCHLSASEMKNLYIHGDHHIELPNDFNQHNKTKHLIVSPDCFKESLMLMQTSRAKEIRKYYLTIEKVFKSYLTYCSQFKDQQLIETKAELEKSKQNSTQFKELIVKKSIFKCDQYVYVATNAIYAKNNIFKIGMTTDLGKRLSGYTTGRCLNDKFSYVYIMKCVDAKALEQYIFSRLETFRYDEERAYKRELYQIHFSMLMNIMKEYELFEQQTTKKFNEAMLEYYNTYDQLKPMDFDELVIQDLSQYVEDKFDIKPEDCYVPPEKYKTNYSQLTNESINDQLRPYGLEIISEYTGKCEDHQMFRCLSVFGHTYSCMYSSVIGSKEQGCVYCRKHCILDQVPFYVYEDQTYTYQTKYDTFAQLKEAEPDINHQLLKNIIREERWLTAHDGKIYSILSPHDGKLELSKSLTEVETAIVQILGIDYDVMKRHTLGVKMNYVIAIDKKSNTAYWGLSNTAMGSKLRYIDSDKPINRKTVAKYVNTNKPYGGYLWITSTTNVHSPYMMVDVESL